MTHALVTGTSSGIGMHTAIGLAAAGLEVTATMRDPARDGALQAAADAAGVHLNVVALDVTDPEAAAAAVGAVAPVDVLVNNAGQGSVGTLEHLTDAHLQAQLEVNLIGVARLTRLVLPGMRERGRGRIVTVTSVGGVVGQPFADAYCAAKFGVEGLMQSLAPVAARFGVEVCVVEPAAVATGFVGSVAGIGTDADPDPDDPYAPLLAAYFARTRAAFADAQPAVDAARVVVEAATTSDHRFRWQTSARAEAFAGLSLADLDGTRVLGLTAGWIA